MGRVKRISATENALDRPMYTRKTLVDLFEASCGRFARNPMFWEKSGEHYASSTYAEMQEQVHAFACGLMDLGIRKGDRIALLSQARKDWVVSELGILYAGAVSVPLSVKLETSELMFRLKHSGARMLIISSFQYPKIKDVLFELPRLDKVIILDPQDKYENIEQYIGDLLEQGSIYMQQHKPVCESKFKAVQPEDCALISYTSGTTADPKGIMLSHKNLVTNTEQSLQMFSVGEDYRLLLILPLDHSFAHTTGMYVFIASGAALASVQLGRTPAASLKNLFTNIQEIKPDALLSVPTLAKNVKKNIDNGIRKKGSFARGLFSLGLKAAYAYNGNGSNRGKGSRKVYWPVYWFVDRMIFRKIRQNFGGKLKYFVGGGALLDLEIQKFFYAIGLPMYQGYGLSEAAPVISSNTIQAHRLGSSGKVVPGLEVRICDEEGNSVKPGDKGEIAVRGDNVMLGYYRNEEATREALRDGWLYTGDLGYFDRDGFLYVLGRFKSLLIGDDGEKYSPEGIEEYIEEISTYIRQVMVYNNQNPYTTALIHPDPQSLKRRLRLKEDSPVSEHTCQEAIEIIKSELESFKEGDQDGSIPTRWLPAAFAIINEGFTEENQFLNSTLKMVRGKITEHYRDRIDQLYTREGKDIMNPQNVKAMHALLTGS